MLPINFEENNNLYKDTYRISTNRANWWNYEWNATYFITICTKNKENFFGRIYMDSHENAVVLLSEIGMIANKYWLEIPKHFPFVVLGSYIIMPNHIHSIIAIHRDVNLEESAEEYSNNWTPESLGVIINQYKRACTLNAKKINRNFGWQSRFYDHIIRNEKAYNKIVEYINNNPVNWIKDEYYNE
jgi:putative transposase